VDSPLPLTRGGIYLARLDPARGAEVGKRRPIAILTAQRLLDIDPPVLFICPLSSRSDPAFAALHLTLPARDQLQIHQHARPGQAGAGQDPASLHQRGLW
jgi:mRNA interferase MazF